MPTDERMVLTLCERMDPDACMDVKDVWLWIQTEAPNRAFVTPQRITSLLREHGYHVTPELQVGTRTRQLLWRTEDAKVKAVNGAPAEDVIKRMQSFIQEPSFVFRNDATM